MPFINIKPTISLNSFAETNTGKLTFGAQDSPPTQEVTLQTRELNWFSRCVEKINENPSLVGKIGRACLTFILAVSLVGIPVLILWKKENELSASDEKTKKVALDTLNLKNQQWNKRAEIVERLGIEDFDYLPILDLQRRTGNYIDFLEPKDLTSPLMKGIDKFDRPFLAIKLNDQQEQMDFVVVLFQRYSDNDRWVYHCENSQRKEHLGLVDGSAIVGPSQEEVFKQIISGKHPRFVLA